MNARRHSPVAAPFSQDHPVCYAVVTPPGGWNLPWSGPPRDIGLAQADFGPFNYNGYNAIPIFNPVFGGWGFWLFGNWIPLY